MIIDCKECGTKFKINEAIYGEKGASVHCGVCSRTFFLSPEAINGEDSTQSQSPTTSEKFSSGGKKDDSNLMLLKEKRELDSILSRIAKGEEISLPENQDAADNPPIADTFVEEDDKRIVLLREKRELDNLLSVMEGKSGAAPDDIVKTTVKAIETPQFKQSPVEEIKKKSDTYPDATVKTTVKAIETPQFKQPPVEEIKKRSDESLVSATITKPIKEKEVVAPYVEKLREQKPAVETVTKQQEKNEIDKPTVTEEKPVSPPEKELPSWKRIRWAMTILFTIFLCIATQSVFIILNPEMGYNATKWISTNIPYMDKYLEVKVPPVLEAVADRIKITNVRQRIVSNSSLGILRVIEGDAVNGAPYPVSGIKVGGELLNAGKKVIARSYSYCGNIISDEELSIITEEDIQKALFVIEGLNSSNSGIQPGGLVPFMIVFTREPENVSDATVKPAWAKRK